MATKLTSRGVRPERLTDKMRLYCYEYPKDHNATQAVIRAGYNTKNPDVIAAKLMKNPLIVATIGKLEKKILDDCEIDIREIVLHLKYLSTRTAHDYRDADGKLLPLHQLSNRAAACVDGFEQTEEILFGKGGEPRGKLVKTKVRLSPKASGIDMAMKHKGLYAAIKEEMNVTVGVVQQVLAERVEERGKSHRIKTRIEQEKTG